MAAATCVKRTDSVASTTDPEMVLVTVGCFSDNIPTFVQGPLSDPEGLSSIAPWNNLVGKRLDMLLPIQVLSAHCNMGLTVRSNLNELEDGYCTLTFSRLQTLM